MFLTLANFSVDIGVHFFGGKETNQKKATADKILALKKIIISYKA